MVVELVLSLRGGAVADCPAFVLSAGLILFVLRERLKRAGTPAFHYGSFRDFRRQVSEDSGIRREAMGGRMYKVDAALTDWINGLAGNELLNQIMITVSIHGVPLLIVARRRPMLKRPRESEHTPPLGRGWPDPPARAEISQVILVFEHRIRPYEAEITRLLIERSTDPSFPSDHATATFAITAAFLITIALGVRSSSF